MSKICEHLRIIDIFRGKYYCASAKWEITGDCRNIKYPCRNNNSVLLVQVEVRDEEVGKEREEYNDS